MARRIGGTRLTRRSDSWGCNMFEQGRCRCCGQTRWCIVVNGVVENVRGMRTGLGRVPRVRDLPVRVRDGVEEFRICVFVEIHVRLLYVPHPTSEGVRRWPSAGSETCFEQLLKIAGRLCYRGVKDREGDDLCSCERSMCGLQVFGFGREGSI